MPEEEKSFIEKRKEKNQQNIQNNAQNLRVAADVASKTSHPVVKAIGEAVKAADKFSGGRTTRHLGKVLNNANKFNPGGRITQKTLNKMSESGTTERIGKAMNKKKPSSSNSKTPMNGKGNTVAQKKENDYFSRREVEEQTSDGGGSSFQLTVKVLKITLIAMVPIMTVVIFINLLTSSSLIVRNVIGVGAADSTPDSEMQQKIDNAESSELEDKDESIENNTAFDSDLFIEDKAVLFRNSKLKKISTREYNEADITQLRDYYPDIVNYESSYKDDVVYTFFFKMHYLYFHYKEKYKVTLDIPLLMSTLSVNSNDMKNVFESNTIGYDKEQVELKSENPRFSYTNAISYESSSTTAEYDMEILAQYMVSRVPYVESEKTCEKRNVIDGMCYIVDYDRYNEFLKEYLEKKYYEGGVLNSSLDNNGSFNNSNNVCTTNQFPKYNLTEDQLIQIASLAYREQGSTKGASAEASLMANLFEIKGSKYGPGADGLYNYIRNGGWFANASTHMDERKAPSEVINVVRNVLVDGKRTLPGYIDEHDCIVCYNDGSGDILSATNDGNSITVTDRSSYIKNKTKMLNKYGSKYTFYSFPTANSDPFGYTSESIRKEKGEFYYDFDTGEPIGCDVNLITGTNLSSSFISLALNQLNDNSKKGGEKYWKYMNFQNRVPWCATFVSWTIENTSFNGQKLKDIIKKQTASTTEFVNYFYESKDSNIKFYYNDNCSNYKGKNNNKDTYIPKEGDLIFFDWQKSWDGIMPTDSQKGLDHIGIVQSVKDGQILTIEGNSGNEVKEQKYNLNSCEVIGFGSWY